ncbi:hypothetical protein QJS10_CPB12g01262 [Acorus calamus]|uniref:Uncharacterized protein n=1 Tax=Acorus calamus TaxID=4465 RepID=A0AAV9DQ23_ACOCL|nr:hypothetical protein QJS10_CPB12g01262 [Acorus calamus]
MSPIDQPKASKNDLSLTNREGKSSDLSPRLKASKVQQEVHRENTQAPTQPPKSPPTEANGTIPHLGSVPSVSEEHLPIMEPSPPSKATGPKESDENKEAPASLVPLEKELEDGLVVLLPISEVSEENYTRPPKIQQAKSHKKKYRGPNTVNAERSEEDSIADSVHHEMDKFMVNGKKTKNDGTKKDDHKSGYLI